MNQIKDELLKKLRFYSELLILRSLDNIFMQKSYCTWTFFIKSANIRIKHYKEDGLIVIIRYFLHISNYVCSFYCAMMNIISQYILY